MFKCVTLSLWLYYFISIAQGGTDADTLRGAQFKVYAFNYPPVMSAVKNSDGNVTSYKGVGVDFMYYFAEHLQLNLEFVPENLSEIAKKGQALPLIQTVASKAVDFSAGPIGPASIQLLPFMDFTSIAFQAMYNFVLPFPEEESLLTAVIRPFNLITWTMIVVSTVTLIAFLAVLPMTNRRLFNRETVVGNTTSVLDILGKATMYVIGIFSQNGGNAEGIGVTNRSSLRLMLGLWLLMMVIIANLYTSTLTSYHTVIKLKPIPNSIEELVSNYEHKEECLATQQKAHPVLKNFYNTSYPPFKKLGEWISQHPETLTNGFDEITERIVKNHCVHFGVAGISTSQRIGQDFQTYGKCRMTVSKPLQLEPFSSAYQLPKNSPDTSIINQYLLQAISSGLMEYWKKWNTVSMDRCKLENNKDNGKMKPIKLIELSSAFLVLGVGITLSALTFLLELFFQYLCRRSSA